MLAWESLSGEAANGHKQPVAHLDDSSPTSCISGLDPNLLVDATAASRLRSTVSDGAQYVAAVSFRPNVR